MMNGLKQWVSQLQPENLVLLLLSAVSCLVCIMFHEVCHGLAAYALGDDTAKRDGRLSFNPLRHIDWVGLLMLLTVHFGWAKPVPVNPGRLRHPKRDMALVALAGPAGNVVLASLLMPLYVFVYYQSLTEPMSMGLFYSVNFLSQTIALNIGLAMFNLIPISPLDGSKILLSVLPPRIYFKIMRYEKYGMILLVVLLWTGILDTPLFFLRDGMTQLIFNLFGRPVLQALA